MQGIEVQIDSTETAGMIPNYTIGLVHLSNSNGLERAMHGGVREIIKCAALPPKEGDGLGAAAGQTASSLPIANRVTAIGHAIWLMSRSPLHKHLMLTDIEWLLIPPIMLNQFHMWQDKGRPHGFASWAYFGEEQEERIAQKGIRRLMPTDWKTGESLWLIDFVAPFGGQEVMVEELRMKILPGKQMKMLQAKPEGGTGVVEW